jgi:hypothetical protein
MTDDPNRRSDAGWRPDRFDYIEARIKRLEERLGLAPLELRQFFEEWDATKRDQT